jgi:hypothetical protein
LGGRDKKIKVQDQPGHKVSETHISTNKLSMMIHNYTSSEMEHIGRRLAVCTKKPETYPKKN